MGLGINIMTGIQAILDGWKYYHMDGSIVRWREYYCMDGSIVTWMEVLLHGSIVT